MDTPSEILKRPYHRVIVRQKDGWWFARIAEFPGCFATSPTASQAASEIDEVAESWLTATIALGQSVPQPWRDVSEKTIA